MAGEGGSGSKGVPDNLLTVSWHDSAWIPVLSQAGNINTKFDAKLCFGKTYLGFSH
jgi:hypothetical protein